MTVVYYRAEYFEKTKEVFYEYTTAMLPTKYDAILTKLYGDWHKFVMGSNSHGEVFFDPDKPWTEYIHKYDEYKDYNQVL